MARPPTPEELPIQRVREAIRAAVREANRLVVVAPTGSGKSTQLPKFLLDSPGIAGDIVVLEPRRLAARTLAAEERQFDVGLRTSTDVLDASASLADAQSREVAALSSYQIALVDLAFATGTSLGAAGIRFEAFSEEELDALEKATDAVMPVGGAHIEESK